MGGAATFTFPPIPRRDMLLAFDAARALSTQPYFEVFCEPNVTRRTTALPAVAGWRADASGEYIQRRDQSEGGVKFGRMLHGPGGVSDGAFLLSSFSTDQTSGRREELSTWGPDVALPKHTDIWIAGRYFLDFGALPRNEWVVLFQLKPTPSMAPILAVSCYWDRVDIITRYNPAAGLPDNYTGTEGVDKITHKGAPGGVAEWAGKWFDLTVQINIDDTGTGDGFVKVWFDDRLMLDRAGPLGFGGLSQSGVERYYNVRWSNYPNGGAWTGGRRDVWLRRVFACRSRPKQALPLIRAALQPGLCHAI